METGSSSLVRVLSLARHRKAVKELLDLNRRSGDSRDRAWVPARFRRGWTT